MTLQKKHLSTKCINKKNKIQPAPVPVRRTVVEAWPTATQKFSTEHSEISLRMFLCIRRTTETKMLSRINTYTSILRQNVWMDHNGLLYQEDLRLSVRAARIHIENTENFGRHF
jgi:hypothetical protein